MNSVDTVSIKPRTMSSKEAVDLLNSLDDEGKQKFVELIIGTNLEFYKRLRALLLEVRNEKLLSYDCSLEDENTSLIIALDALIGDN